MDVSPLDYLNGLVQGIPLLETALLQSLNKYETGKPPLTLIFAEIGDVIASNLVSFPDDVLKRLFDKIEEGMASTNQMLVGAVATGLVEALVSSADKEPSLWSEYSKIFGSRTMEHAKAWRDF